MEDLKQVIIVRADLKLPKGKMAAQVGHACVEAVHKSDKEKIKAWRNEGQMKVVLKVADEKALYKFVQEAKDDGLTVATITDAGKTVIAPGTVTCAAIGPDIIEKIDAVTSDLPLM